MYHLRFWVKSWCQSIFVASHFIPLISRAPPRLLFLDPISFFGGVSCRPSLTNGNRVDDYGGM